MKKVTAKMWIEAVKRGYDLEYQLAAMTARAEKAEAERVNPFSMDQLWELYHNLCSEGGTNGDLVRKLYNHLLDNGMIRRAVYEKRLQHQ